MIAPFTLEHGQVAVLVAVGPASAECLGLHAALRGIRYRAIEPIRQAVVKRFGPIARDTAQGHSIRHVHASQSMSHDLEKEIA